MNWSFIRFPEELTLFCDQVSFEDPSFIAIDCEFVRQNTYWPELGLIQIATPSRTVAIDPITNNLSLFPLKEILLNPKITKVLHSARQDVEIFYYLFACCPDPIFDTQIAAAFTGMGEGISYEKLIFDLLTIKIDKKEQFTDWLSRPLSDSQLQYAVNDVIYLKEVYPLLLDKLEKLGRLNWVTDKCQDLFQPSIFDVKCEEAGKKIKTNFKSWQQFSVLWDLAIWREEQALSKNIRRNLLAENNLLIHLSTSSVRDEISLKESLNSFKQTITENLLFESFYNSYKKALRFLDSSSSLVDYRQKEIMKHLKESSSFILSCSQKQNIKNIQNEIKKIAANLNISPFLLANRQEIESFVRFPDHAHSLFKKWRGEVLGCYLTTFLKTND